MPRILRPFALTLTFLAWLCPMASEASVLTLAGGTLTFKVSGLPSVSIDQGAALPIFVSSGGGDFALPASAFDGNAMSVSIFTNDLINTLNATAVNASGSLAAGAGPGSGFGGLAGLSGQLVLGALGGLVNIQIPLSPVGAGGFTRRVSGLTANPIVVSVTGHAWTTGVASVTGLSFTTRPTPLASPNWINTVSVSGADARTAGHSGSLTLVTPFRVSSNPFGVNQAFATQVLTFVPEPGTLVFFLSGAGLVLLARYARS